MDFCKRCEVAVAGGGIAGVAAAVQAARCGKKTVLIEKSVYCGGLATGGLIYIYLPLCDGNGRQVTFGIAEELLRRSMKYGPGDVPSAWRLGKEAGERNRFRNVFSPAAYIIALDEFLEENGVEVWFDTVVCGVRCEGEKLEAVTVCNKSGIGEICAERFIDATGDAELFRKCGVPCHDADNSLAVWALEFRRGEKIPGRSERSWGMRFLFFRKIPEAVSAGSAGAWFQNTCSPAVKYSGNVMRSRRKTVMTAIPCLFRQCLSSGKYGRWMPHTFWRGAMRRRRLRIRSAWRVIGGRPVRYGKFRIARFIH